jgi:hypothetical protein
MALTHAEAQSLRPYRAAIHIPSTFSTGKLTINELAKMAHQRAG